MATKTESLDDARKTAWRQFLDDYQTLRTFVYRYRRHPAPTRWGPQA